MKNHDLDVIARLLDCELLSAVRALAARERQATAELIAHLAILDTREVHLLQGYGSLFSYCTYALGLSESETFNRIEVARAARRFPVVLDLLAEGSVSLTTIRRLAPHLTADNHREVLASARGKRKTEVEGIVARLAPRPAVPFSVRKLPSGGPTMALVVAPPVASDLPPAASGKTPAAAAQTPSAQTPSARTPAARTPAAPAPTPARAAQTPAASAGGPGSRGAVVAPPVPGRGTDAVVVPPVPGRENGAVVASPVPNRQTDGQEVCERASTAAHSRPPAVTTLAPDRYRLQVTIDAQTLEKLRLAQQMLGHAVPGGGEAEILGRALDALLVQLARTRFAATDRPRQATPAPASGGRHIPAAVKRAVWLRDLGRCAFVGTTGRHCHERKALEFHHRHPVALGGKATAADISLRCRMHHRCETRADFGDRRPGCSGTASSRWQGAGVGSAGQVAPTSPA